MITSLTNERVKKWAKLNNKKFRDETNSFLVEGEHLVMEAKALGIIIEIITTDNMMEGILVSEDVMKKITNQSSIVKCCAVCRKQNNDFLSDKVVILDNIQDPGNVGTILRTALSFGFKTVFMDNCADIYSSKVLRATQGAIFKMCIIEELAKKTVDTLRKKGYTIYGTSLKDAKPLRQIERKEKMALILGNEGFGVKKEVLDVTDQNIFIEIDDMESLNVAVAGGIIMYKLGGLQWQK